jgi:hypothetical protein
MATVPNVRHRTLEEFLAWEREQPQRYERISGVIRMMTGGTIDHDRLTLGTADALARRLSGGDCEVFTRVARSSSSMLIVIRRMPSAPFLGAG